MEEDTKSPNTTGTTCAVLKNVQDSTFSEQAEESVIPGVMAAPKNRKKDSPLELISISAEGDEVDTQEAHTASSLGNTGTDPFKAKSLIEKQDNLQMTLPSPIPSFVVDAGMATKEVSKKHIEIQAVPGSPVPPASTTFPPRQIVLATPPVSSDGQPASPPLEPGTTKDTSLQVVAELVPDAEELAARVAQQLEEQMDSQWEQHLQQVIQSKVLGDNQFHGSLPSEMGDLAVLERFIAQANDLTGTVPSDLGRLKLLERVDLSWNRLEGTLPTELGNLQNLNQLYLVGNPALSGSIPSDFGGLTALNILYLQDTSLTGSVDATLCFLNNTSLSITADCLGDEPELECSCCMRCCDTEGEECEVMTSSSRV
eukprot:Nitzschia sp. Nitz4//scaffold187_size43274//8756//10702//NITZ4_007330-RA/size43274-processed-gene-0.51-mRNA-1//1//CDS//3329539798//5459//frame0